MMFRHWKDENGDDEMKIEVESDPRCKRELEFSPTLVCCCWSESVVMVRAI